MGSSPTNQLLSKVGHALFLLFLMKDALAKHCESLYQIVKLTLTLLTSTIFSAKFGLGA
jgi:hypothetical protein